MIGHFPTCRKCGCSGPPVSYETKQGETKKVCAWCLDRLRKVVAARG